MQIQISKKEWQLLLIGFLLGVITVLTIIKIVDTPREDEYVQVSLDDLEQNPVEDPSMVEMIPSSVDQTDLEGY